MCTGRIDLSFIIRAYAKGADGVIIGGCWPGECHYVTEGNFDALANVHLCRKLLAKVGLRPERLRIEWIAASEGSRFAEVMSYFSRQITALGPIGGVESIDATALKLRLDAVDRLVPYVKLVERERLRPPTRSESAINAYYESPEVQRLFDTLVEEKLVAGQIMLLLSHGPLSTSELSEKLSLSSTAVARQMKRSSNQGLVSYDVDRQRYALACGGSGGKPSGTQAE
jgi:F420-non-reducing hydrogenase iron-sulfur subunit